MSRIFKWLAPLLVVFSFVFLGIRCRSKPARPDPHAVVEDFFSVQKNALADGVVRNFKPFADHFYFSPEQMTWILKDQRLPLVRELFLTSNDDQIYPDNDVLKIIFASEKISSVREIEFSFSKNINDESIRILSQKPLPDLQTLLLPANAIDGAALTLLTDKKIFPKLKELDLSFMRFKPGAGYALAKLDGFHWVRLKGQWHSALHSKLPPEQLVDVTFPPEELAAIIENACVQSLDLTDSSARHALSILKERSPCLNDLNLTRTQITDEDLIQFVTLPGPALKFLTLDYNPALTAKSLRVLLATPWFDGLEFLGLVGIELPKDLENEFDERWKKAGKPDRSLTINRLKQKD